MERETITESCDLEALQDNISLPPYSTIPSIAWICALDIAYDNVSHLLIELMSASSESLLMIMLGREEDRRGTRFGGRM